VPSSYDETQRAYGFGNGAAMFTRDAFADKVEAGMVGINVADPVPVAYHSFGGWKQSIFGDHFTHQPEGVRFDNRLKTVTSCWPEGIRAGAVFTFPISKGSQAMMRSPGRLADFAVPGLGRRRACAGHDNMVIGMRR
jgi:hypothetical protein